MKKLKILLTFSLGLSTLLNAQDLYVSDNSFVFVQDQVLFVNNDIQLKDNSHIYLRDEAQLLQNEDVKNSDGGSLSVYQKQTSFGGVATGIHQYNYWSSPVGTPEAITGANVVSSDKKYKL
jgi:hypothetical protein